MRQEKLRDSLAGMSKACSVSSVLPRVRRRRTGSGRGRQLKREPHFAFLPGGGLVGDLDGELEHVAFAQEARRVGLHHQVLGGDGLVFEETGAELPVMGEAQEPPGRERLGHGEGHAHDAVGR